MTKRAIKWTPIKLEQLRIATERATESIPNIQEWTMEVYEDENANIQTYFHIPPIDSGPPPVPVWARGQGLFLKGE